MASKPSNKKEFSSKQQKEESLSYSHHTNGKDLAVKGSKAVYDKALKKIGARWNPRMKGGAGWLLIKEKEPELLKIVKIQELEHISSLQQNDTSGDRENTGIDKSPTSSSSKSKKNLSSEKKFNDAHHHHPRPHPQQKIKESPKTVLSVPQHHNEDKANFFKDFAKTFDRRLSDSSMSSFASSSSPSENISSDESDGGPRINIKREPMIPLKHHKAYIEARDKEDKKFKHKVYKKIQSLTDENTRFEEDIRYYKEKLVMMEKSMKSMRKKIDKTRKTSRGSERERSR